MIRKNFKKQIILSLLFSVILNFPQTTLAKVILFQNDDFSTLDSDGLIIDNNDSVLSNGNITIQFGKTLGKIFQWDGTNNRFNLSDTLHIANNLLVNAKAIFGSSSLPSTVMDVVGDFALRKADITISTPTNPTNINDLNIGSASFVRILGATNPFNLTGINGGVDGKKVYLYNTTAQNMTITDNDTNSISANRIVTQTGASNSTTGEGDAVFIYDAGQSKWLNVITKS